MAAHYEERLQQDLALIQERVGDVSKALEKALDGAVRALLTVDKQLAAETILRDLYINRSVRRLDSQCHAFVARHLPAAGHLRFISAVLRLGVALERIGDYAVTICREAVQLTAEPPAAVARDVEMLADQARKVFKQAMRAFLEQNSELAKGAHVAGQLTSTVTKVFADLVREGEQGSRPVRDLFALLVVFNRLERVCDQAKNICEGVVFAVTGDDKAPKRYEVLFVDERNDRVSQMAELHARKAYPQSGRYRSAGWKPAEALDSEVAAFLDGRGYDVGEARPHQLETIHEELADYHVIVDLAGGLMERVGELPFHTVILTWPIDPAGASSLDDVHSEVMTKVGELMEALRGQGAA